jgi:hypothetical protein
MLGDDGNRLNLLQFQQPPECADKAWHRALAQAPAKGVDASSN